MINKSQTVFTVIQNENKAIFIAAMLKKDKRLKLMLPYKTKAGKEYYIFYYNVK